MQPIAAWLVARPERAVFALIVSFLLPITQILGSAVLVLQMLGKGLTRAALVAGLSFVAILVFALLRAEPVSRIFQVALTIWVPGMGLAILLQRMRSLTLLMQTTALIAMLFMAGLYLVLGDPAAYWLQMLEKLAGIWRDAGLQEEAELFAQLQPFAPQMTGIAVAVGWLLHVAAFLVGYAAFVSLPDASPGFGRFSDLNFGRVLAIVLALASIAAIISTAVWLQNFAFLLFVAFWLQGLALLHWLKREGRMPGVALVAIYALTILLGPLLVTAVGVIGYTDAWFNYRPRIAGI